MLGVITDVLRVAEDEGGIAGGIWERRIIRADCIQNLILFSGNCNSQTVGRVLERKR